MPHDIIDIPKAPKMPRWAIVVLERGFTYVGKLSYDERGNGVLTDAANIYQWGTTQGICQIQEGPTSETILVKCPGPIRFAHFIHMLDASTEGWEDAY